MAGNIDGTVGNIDDGVDGDRCEYDRLFGKTIGIGVELSTICDFVEGMIDTVMPKIHTER